MRAAYIKNTRAADEAPWPTPTTQPEPPVTTYRTTVATRTVTTRTINGTEFPVTNTVKRVACAE